MRDRVFRLVNRLKELGLTLAFAESCTGGKCCSLVSSVAGVSEVFWGGIVSYSYAAKKSILSVSNDSLDSFGAVSEVVVQEMLVGLKNISGADVCGAISGFAGPSGDSVGTVFIGLYFNGEFLIKKYFFDGDREKIQNRAVETMFSMIEEVLK